MSTRTLGSEFNQWQRCDVSACTFATIQNTHFRNGEGREVMGDVESVARKIVGGLGYAGLLVASIIETIARGLIFIPTYFYCIFALDRENKPADADRAEYLTNLSMTGAIISAENAINCALAIVHSIRSHDKKINYDELAGCSADYHKDHFEGPPFTERETELAHIDGELARETVSEKDSSASKADTTVASQPEPSAPADSSAQTATKAASESTVAPSAPAAEHPAA